MSGVVKRQDKADIIAEMLESLYPEIPVPLDHTNAFELLVAVLMSAQTTDLKVNEVTPALFAKASSAREMAALDVDTILADIRQVGLAPTKARNIKRLSEMLVEHHGGEVPASFEALEALPGVGHKTASVVMAQAFDVPAFPVDTHIHRLAARWGLSNGTTVENRKGPEGGVPSGKVERPAFANHLLWQRTLPCSLPRSHAVPHLLVGSDEKADSRRNEALTSEQGKAVIRPGR